MVKQMKNLSKVHKRMNETTIRHAFIGLGRICSLLEKDSFREKPCTHAGAVSKQKNSSIIAGCDIDILRQQDFKNRWNCSTTYSDYNEMLNNESIDILHVTTPPESHFQIVNAGIKSAIPIIICEKPITDSIESAKQMINVEKASKTRIIINHERRYSTNYQKALEIIQSKKYGELLSIEGSMLGGGKQPSADLFLHDGTHLVDIVRFLTQGNLDNIIHFGNPDQNGSLFTFFNSIQSDGKEIPCSLHIGSGRSYFEFYLEIHFSEGRIRIGNGLFEVARSMPSPYYKNFNSLKVEKKIKFHKTGYFTNMVKDAVKAFQEPNYIPISTASDGYEALKAIMTP